VRRGLGLLGWIQASLVVLLLVVVLRRSEPEALGRCAAGASVNKAHGSCWFGHVGLMVRLSFSAHGDLERTEFLAVGCCGMDWRCRCWEAQLRSEGVQAKLQFSGSEIYKLKEEFQADVSEVAIGSAYQQRRLFGSYAAHGGGRRAAFSEGYAALCCGRLAVFRPPLPLLVEWRPFDFLPASEPEGRQCLFITTSKPRHATNATDCSRCT
jgi:hypothetical protein